MSEHPRCEPSLHVLNADSSKYTKRSNVIADEGFIRSKLIAIARALARVAACEDAMDEERAGMERKQRPVPGDVPEVR